MKVKEVAKFFAGVAASQTLTHGGLAASGVQFTLFGINYTPALNSTAAVVWTLILALLFYFAWLKK